MVSSSSITGSKKSLRDTSFKYFDKISKISKDLGIYNNVPELLSVSLGSNETTLLNLTNAYCIFINGGKKVKPILISRIQDRRGNTIFNSEERNCKNKKKHF